LNAKRETGELPKLADHATFRPGQQNPYLRIFKSTVFVRDHDRSLKFYVDQLGFSVVADGRFEFDRWVAIAPPDGSAILALVAPKRGSENYKHIGRNTHIGFIAEDIYATYDLWRSRGVHFHHPPQPQLWGGTFAGFSDEDGNSFELLGSDEMSREIERQRRANDERLEFERRTARELEIAKQVQARLFPQTYPPLRTLDYAGICIQARHVGGDYYDFFALGEDRVGLFIGDISGKGIAAALLMANLQANLRSQFALAREQPHRFLQSVNRLFSKIRWTAPMLPSSLPNTTTLRGACATRIVGISPLCYSAAMTPWNGSPPPPRCWDSSRIGRARRWNANSSPAISSPSTPMA